MNHFKSHTKKHAITPRAGAHPSPPKGCLIGGSATLEKQQMRKITLLYGADVSLVKIAHAFSKAGCELRYRDGCYVILAKTDKRDRQ